MHLIRRSFCKQHIRGQAIILSECQFARKRICEVRRSVAEEELHLTSRRSCSQRCMRRGLLHFLRTRSSQLFGPWEVLSVNFTGAKKVIYMFPSHTLLSSFFSVFLLRPLWAHHASWRLNCLVSLPSFHCKSSLFLHYFVKTKCYLCYSVAPVSNSFPSTGGISSKIFSWRFKTVSNPLANWQFLNHQGLKVV